MTTVSQFVYSANDEDEIEPRGALEIRSKLMSRQAVLIAATGTKFDHNVNKKVNLYIKYVIITKYLSNSKFYLD